MRLPWRFPLDVWVQWCVLRLNKRKGKFWELPQIEPLNSTGECTANQFWHCFRHRFTSHEGNTFLLHSVANALFLAHLVQICHFKHGLRASIKWVHVSPKESTFKFLDPLPTKIQKERYETPSVLPKPNPEGPPHWDHNFLFLLIWLYE